jgi:hypothetical protein
VTQAMAMAVANPLADALRARQFCYVVELVASAMKREAQVLEIGARLAMVSRQTCTSPASTTTAQES